MIDHSQLCLLRTQVVVPMLSSLELGHGTGPEVTRFSDLGSAGHPAPPVRFLSIPYKKMDRSKICSENSESGPILSAALREIPGTAAAPCITAGCDHAVVYPQHELCRPCYLKQLRRGWIEADPSRSGAAHNTWKGDHVTYSGAHDRVISSYGFARRYRCATCLERARHWSLVPGRGDRCAVETHYLFSVDPADYVPQCPACHVHTDRLARAWRANLERTAEMLPGDWDPYLVAPTVPVVRELWAGDPQ